MFGILRLSFALMVVAGKFVGVEVIPGIGVWGFFLLSGFLITLVLNEKYSYSKGGLRKFFVSRFLRLYPCYYAVMLLTLFLYVYVLEYSLSEIGESFFCTYRDVTANLLIFSNTIFGIGRADVVVPISWAVDVEMMMYVTSVVIIARSPKCALYSLASTAVLFPILWVLSKDLMASGQNVIANNLLYSFLPAALLPYSLGSAIYHYRDLLFFKFSKIRAICLLLTLICIGLFIPKFSVTVAFLASLPITALLVSMLYRVKRSKFDDLMGDLTYPIYLMIGTINTVLLQTSFFNSPSLLGSSNYYSPLGVLCAFLILILTAFALLFFVERPILNYRKRFLSRLHVST